MYESPYLVEITVFVFFMIKMYQNCFLSKYDNSYTYRKTLSSWLVESEHQIRYNFKNSFLKAMKKLLNGMETGAWDFIYNGLYGYDTLTFVSLQLKAHSFVEATNGSDNINVRH